MVTRLFSYIHNFKSTVYNAILNPIAQTLFTDVIMTKAIMNGHLAPKTDIFFINLVTYTIH